MTKARKRRSRALALLATTLFLLAAVSFHSAADNDLGRLVSESRLQGPSALADVDRCSACALDGLLSVRPSLSAPVGVGSATERRVTIIPVAPFVAPRASVDSRPPPAIA
jgi:hypothetical protein